MKTKSPRLRCKEKWSNGFYGTYKGHTICMERESKDRPWAVLVVDSKGVPCVDGYTKGPMELKDAIAFALKGAGLYMRDP